MVVYTGDFQAIQRDIEIPMENTKGNLLYNVRGSADGRQFLFAHNYLADCDLILEKY